jgi:hypothetical protein
VYQIYFSLQISAMTENVPEGYLFICPTTDLQPSPGAFRLLECPAYWSTDPSGTERLSTEDATDLGFPSIEFTMEVGGYSWDERVYTGLRTFHRAKGFDPDSQDVARHLNLQLYELSNQLNHPFAHGEGAQSHIITADILGVEEFASEHGDEEIIPELSDNGSSESYPLSKPS